MVFFKRHRHLPPNQCLQKLTRYPTLRSDVVVMSVGVNAAYVNMKGREGALADWMMKRFAKNSRLRHKHVPKAMFYQK
ncbi:hypothetical protein CPB84DRAFT_550607 [Gymnopilus junonius]|uniref:Uncharacterized protein n=1 Tax=Gymnopilus junonius TaxID=109634 RepID=A0A9P5NRK1_GYMJU|nr:hypothetical protein CPB84DRAFT_550607 [Gymnopilus junonius]